jgi:hypothetical protein
MRRLATSLAAKLGRDQSDVLAALKAVAKGRIDTAVKDGLLPARLGNRLKADIDSGTCTRPRLRRGMQGAFRGGPPPGLPQ